MDALGLEAAWRKRMRSLHDRWEARLITGGALSVPLREIVQTPRLQSVHTGEPWPSQPDAFVAKRVVIEGPAGSGKTTVARWIFDGLVQHPGALPLLIDLGELGRKWRDQASLDDLLQEQLYAVVPEAPKGALQAMLQDVDRPRVLLILDGWDELGERGAALLGRLLGLCHRFDRLDVLVTTRPGATGVPTLADRFEPLVMRPLTDGDIRALSERVLGHMGVPDPAQAALDFADALERRPGARTLAQRPLLLLMLLLLQPYGGLPRTRHSLYRACIERLLELREGAELEGVLADQGVTPLIALQELAFRLQSSSGPLNRTLPKGWTGRCRKAFMQWALQDSGLMELRGGQLHFVHRSIQEYLAASSLNGHFPDLTRRKARFVKLAGEPGWFEVMRLWASIADDDEPVDDWVDALLDRTHDALAGCLLAEGLGTAFAMDRWTTRWATSLAAAPVDRSAVCALAWGSSVEVPRIEQLSAALVLQARDAHWDGWHRLKEFCLDGELPSEPVRHARNTVTGAVLDAIDGRVEVEWNVAAGRFLGEGSPLWPGAPWQIALLGLWPTRRVGIGRTLQRLATLGDSVDDLRAAARALPTPVHTAHWQAALAREWTYFLDDHGTYSVAQQWAHHLAQNHPRGPAPFTRDHTVQAVAETHTPWAVGGAVALLRSACQARVTRDHAALDQALEHRQEDPLWRALALALAGRAAPRDRALLLSLVNAPEQRTAPVSWGLRWVVRGDVLLLDGTVVSLEELGVDAPLLEM
jgi:hypothetical protein